MDPVAPAALAHRAHLGGASRVSAARPEGLQRQLRETVKERRQQNASLRQRNQATQEGVRGHIEGPSEERPLLQILRRKSPLSGSARQSGNLSQTRKWIGRFLPDGRVLASA